MKNINLLILTFILSFPFVGKTQIADNYIGKMLSFAEDKAYLSFDKPYYTTGETMYFKAFLTNATSHAIDSFPTVLYVDFIEPNSKRVIQQQKLKVVNGHASGSFVTEGVATNPSGIVGQVFVHAYTRWMNNLAADYHFNKTIQVFAAKDPLALLPPIKKTEKDPKKRGILPAVKVEVPEVNNDSLRRLREAAQNANASEQSPISPVKKVKSLQFFPESGHFLEGFANRMAFKATDEEGKGIDIQGVVKNQAGDVTNKLSNSFLGMGRFTIVAKKGETYTAFIDNKDGTTTAFPLPNAETNGAVIVVEQKNDTADVKLTFYINYDTANMPNAFYALAHQRGKVCYYNPVLVKNKQTLRLFKLLIPRKEFNEEGIATVILFNDKGTPIAERLFFIQNKKRQLDIKLTTEKTVFNKRERITLTIDTKTTDGQPVAADLSLAVTNDSKVLPPQYNEDFRAYMLLRSDLRGHIEKPSYYFEDTTAKARLALDNLLMTQGWRRFTWHEKVDSIRFKYEAGLSVEATLRNRKKPAEDAMLVLFLGKTEEKIQPLFTQTDKKGRFFVNYLDFKDSAALYVNIANSNRTYTVEEEPAKPTPSVSDPKIYLADQPSGNLEAYLEGSQAVLLSQKLRAEREIMLQEIEVKARKVDPFEKDSRISYNMTDRSYKIDDNESGSLLSYLQGRGIRTRTSSDGDVQLLQGRGSNSVYGIVVDGVGQFDGRMLNNMFMNDIQRIDIVNFGNGGYMTGNANSFSDDAGDLSSGGGGMVSSSQTEGFVHILTKSGDPEYWKKYGSTIKSDVPMLVLKGYTSPRRFYIPDYDDNKAENSLPDHRTTIYWTPHVQTDKNGKATVSFYTSDDTQIGKILVEGVDGTGKIGVVKGTFRVE